MVWDQLTSNPEILWGAILACVIVVSIQAYIFAALSAIYIGSAIEPEH